MGFKDLIIGNVMSVIDEETVELQVIRVARNNVHNYGDREKIHINKLEPVEFVSLHGMYSKHQLERMLMGREVMCVVNSLSAGSGIEADVFMSCF
ncbi:MAG: hypothetical protein GTO08_01395 [Deltaproteobacteria bacterium]|nr:hypothetical protein [Deltaproteobacteria bacterium]